MLSVKYSPFVTYVYGMSCPVEGCPRDQLYESPESFEIHWLKHHEELVQHYGCNICPYNRRKPIDDVKACPNFLYHLHYHHNKKIHKNLDEIPLGYGKNVITINHQYHDPGIYKFSPLDNLRKRRKTVEKTVSYLATKNKHKHAENIQFRKDMLCPVVLCPYRSPFAQCEDLVEHWNTSHQVVGVFYVCVDCRNNERGLVMDRTLEGIRDHLALYHDFHSNINLKLHKHMVCREGHQNQTYINPSPYVFKLADHSKYLWLYYLKPCFNI